MRPTTAYITSSYGARYLAVHSLFKEMFRSTRPPETRALFVWLMENSLFLLLLFFLCNICTFCQVNTIHVILYFLYLFTYVWRVYGYKLCTYMLSPAKPSAVGPLGPSDSFSLAISYNFRAFGWVPWRVGKLFCREYYVGFQNGRTQRELSERIFVNFFFIKVQGIQHWNSSSSARSTSWLCG